MEVGKGGSANHDCGSTPDRRLAALNSFLGNFANSLLVSLQAIFLVPIVLRAVGPLVYGVWLASGDLLTWIQVLDFGLPNLLIQRVGAAHGNRDHVLAGKWFMTGALVIGGLALVLTGTGVFIAAAVPGFFHLSGEGAELIRACFTLGCLAAGVALFNNAFVGLGRAIQETKYLNIVMIASSFVGLLTALLLLWRGMWLWAVAIAMLLRSLVSLTGSAWFLVAVVPKELRSKFRLDRGVLRAYLTSIPATSFGGIGFALVSQSETAIAGILAGPQVALVYNLSRKAADMGKALVDMIGFASYGGFAHLVAASKPSEVRRVYLEIRFLRLAAAIAVACVFLVVNHALVRIWVGESAFGGALLTGLFAVQLIATGETYLVNYLFRATGAVEQGSWILACEALCRIVVMTAGMRLLGLPGIPVTSILISIPFLIWMDRLLMDRTESLSPGLETWRVLGRTYLLGGGLLAVTGYFSIGLVDLSWVAILTLAPLVFVLVLLVLLGGAHSSSRANTLTTLKSLLVFRSH